MTKEELAARLSGLEYRQEIAQDLQMAAKLNGLVILYGQSDDLMEFRGAIEEELDAYEGRKVLITQDGLWDDSECHDKCVYYRLAKKEAEQRGQIIAALWDPGDGYSWQFKTHIPHATFEITEDGEPYCRGIVFALQDIS